MNKQVVDDLTRQFSDEGRLIEAGWTALRYMCIPATASQVQIEEMRKAFFAGAQHVFGSLMITLDPGTEPTENDFRRLDLISKELSEWVAQMDAEKWTEARNQPN